MSKNNLERERSTDQLTPIQQLNRAHAEKGIIVHDGAKNGRPHIEVSLGDGIVARIDRPCSWELVDPRDFTEISIKNGGDPLPIVAAHYLPDGRHELFFLVEDGVLVSSPIISGSDLGLDIAYALAAIKQPDNSIQSDYPHVDPIVEHILESVSRLRDH